jgi:hypothetical protein
MASQARSFYQALLSLAISQKQALESDDFDEVADLMNKREQLMTEMQLNSRLFLQRTLRGVLRQDPSLLDTIKLIIEIDKQVENGLMGRMAQVQTELKSLQSGDRIVSMYRPARLQTAGSFNAAG